jgi:DNA-binding IclR family transcriptional regulator
VYEAAAREVLGQVDLARIAQPALEELGRAYQETVLLGVLDAGGVRFIAGRESELLLRVAGHFDQVFAPHASASGLVLLASLTSKELLMRYPAERILSSQSRAIAKRSELERELKQVRANGYAIVSETTAPGVSAIAVPVVDASGTTIAALTLIAPTSRYPVKKLLGCVRPLQKTASRIGASIN